MLQQSRQTGELRLGQPAGGPRGWSMPEGFRAPLSAARHPLTDRAVAAPKGRSDLALRPTLLFEAPGLHASRFLPVVR
jgi:hypothetical protein